MVDQMKVFWCLILYSKVVLALKYTYSDGSYYVGSVDDLGRPSGSGQYHNSSGQLGK